MAITPAACQAVIGTTLMDPQILRADETQGEITTSQEWYVTGGTYAPGVTKWCTTTASDNAATQGASILAQLRA